MIPRVATILALVGMASGAPSISAQTLAGADFYRAMHGADSLHESGERALTIDIYRRIVESDSAHARAWYRLGRGYESIERWADAAEALERAHAIGYRFPWWIARRIAEHRARLGQTELALEWLERALTRATATAWTSSSRLCPCCSIRSMKGSTSSPARLTGRPWSATG